MASPIHGFQTEGIPGSPAALWFYKTDPDVFSSPEYSVNVTSVIRIETTPAHTPVTLTFSQGTITILLGDPAISFIGDLIAFAAAGGITPVSTGDELTWNLTLQVLSNSTNPFGDFGDKTNASRLYVGAPESSLNAIGQGYFKSFGVDVGEEGIRGGLFTSIGGVTLAAINDGEPGHHMGVAIYALGIRHNTSDDGVAALGSDSYNDSGGNAIAVHGYTSSIGVPASSLYDFYAFHNDGSCTGISAGFYSATQAGTSSSLNAAFYAADQGTGAHDYGIYSAGGKVAITGDFLFTSDNGYDIGDSASSDVVLFSSDFPTSGDWPLPASWLDESSGTIAWASPNHVVFGVLPSTTGDGYSIFQTPVGSAGGAVSFVVHGPSTGGVDLYFDTSITGTGTDGYWLFLDQAEHSFQKFHNGAVVATYESNSVPYSIPAGDHKYELSWRSVGTSAIVSYSIDGVTQVAAMDPTPPSSPLYPIFEPYGVQTPYATSSIDIGSLKVISYVPTRPRTGYFGTSVVASDGYFGNISVATGLQIGGTATSGRVLMGDGTNFVSSSVTRAISYVIDGGGALPATGVYGQLNIPIACTVTGWVLTGNVAGACVVDVNRSTYSGFPTCPSIAGSDLPTITATNQKAENLGPLSGWGSTALSAGDQIQFDLDSVTSITRINITLIVTVP